MATSAETSKHLINNSMADLSGLGDKMQESVPKSSFQTAASQPN